MDKLDTPQTQTVLTDAQLMRALARGDMNALAELVRRHQHSIRAIAYRMCGRWDLADDVAQDTFLRMHRSASRYEPSAAFRTWLYRIVVNLCLDSTRKPRPQPLTEAIPADRGRTAQTPLMEDELIRAVHDAVAALPERQRIAVILHRFEKLTHGQIASATGWSESAVESLLTRAYQQLRESLREWSHV